MQLVLSQTFRKRLVLLLFWCILLFQLTELKYIWEIPFISRIVNFSMLAILLIMGFYTIIFHRFTMKSFGLFLLPSLLIIIGLLINITLNVFNDSALISYYWLLLPWTAILCVPILLKTGSLDPLQLWEHFYYFLLISVSLSLVEYLLVFFYSYPLRVAVFPQGSFLVGKFTLFHMMQDVSPNERFYASFGEPGSLAMYLLPAMAYAMYKKRYYALIVFLPAFYFTYSLGGTMSLVLMGCLLPIFLFTSKASKFIFIASILIGGFIAGAVIYEEFSFTYEERGNSAKTREDNFINTLLLLPEAAVNSPLGLDLALTTEKNENNKFYFGSNFTPGYAFITGGIFGFFGYCWILFVSVGISIKVLFFSKQDKIFKVVGVLLLVFAPFIFQRLTIWESPLFALMYLPFLIQSIEKINKLQKSRIKIAIHE